MLQPDLLIVVTDTYHTDESIVERTYLPYMSHGVISIVNLMTSNVVNWQTSGKPGDDFVSF